MMEEEKVCGTCVWHTCEIYPDFICANKDSENYAMYTQYGDSCDEWEDKT